MNRLIEQPPLAYRLLFPEAIWRVKRRNKPTVFLTFDDGPIPEVTPWVLDTLREAGNVPATFFMVGDNARRNPDLVERVRAEGHSIGNHSMHHLQGMKTDTRTYLRDIAEANRILDTTLFRPPHGIMRWSQAAALKHHLNIVMYDVVTRDYSRKATPERVLQNVKRYARNGSIIVFHDSLKAERNLRYALPKAIEWLQEQGYALEPLIAH